MNLSKGINKNSTEYLFNISNNFVSLLSDLHDLFSKSNFFIGIYETNFSE